MSGWRRFRKLDHIHALDGASHGFTNHVEGEDEDADENGDKEDEYQPYASKNRVDEEINEIDLRHNSSIHQNEN